MPIIKYLLKILARLILWRYRPQVVGITGSIGKTSAREAICTVLASRFRVRASLKNYNNEIGLPLSIIGVPSPGKSLVGWIKIFIYACRLLVIKDKNFPEVLVLEMGVDHPQDMDYLLTIVKPNIGVITFVGPVHLEFFGSIENIQKEKAKLVANLAPDGWAILNYDNELTRQIGEKSKVKVITFGFGTKADVRALETTYGYAHGEGNNIMGVNYKLSWRGSAVPVTLPRVLGKPPVYASLAAASVGIIFGLNLVEVSQALLEFHSPKGRTNLLLGIKDTLIIDDSYNASPQSTCAAIDILWEMPLGKEGGRRIAVLGDMLELGHFSGRAHREVGEYLAKAKIDFLVGVGELVQHIIQGAREARYPQSKIKFFADSLKAAEFLKSFLQPGDVILVKGSQGVRLERVVKAIMRHPERAEELLVRQGKEWQNK